VTRQLLDAKLVGCIRCPESSSGGGVKFLGTRDQEFYG